MSNFDNDTNIRELSTEEQFEYLLETAEESDTFETVNDEEYRFTAYHESGAALRADLLPSGDLLIENHASDSRTWLDISVILAEQVLRFA